MKTVKFISVLVFSVFIFVGCVQNDSAMHSSSFTQSTVSSENIKSNGSVKEKSIYQEMYTNYSNEITKILSNLRQLAGSEIAEENSDNLTFETKKHSYKNIPCEVKKTSIKGEDTPIQYSVTLTDEKKVTQILYYFDENDISYFQEVILEYPTSEKLPSTIANFSTHEYFKKQTEQETFCIIPQLKICVPIENKNIFSLQEMELFFQTGTGELPEGDIVLEKSLDEILENTKITNIEFSKELYNKYNQESEKTISEYSYDSSTTLQKKYILQEGYTPEDMIDSEYVGYYSTKISTPTSNNVHYLQEFSAVGGQTANICYKIDEATVLVVSSFTGYANWNWEKTNSKIVYTLGVTKKIHDSMNNKEYYMVPELGVVTEYDAYYDTEEDIYYNLTFSGIEDGFNSSTEIIT